VGPGYQRLGAYPFGFWLAGPGPGPNLELGHFGSPRTFFLFYISFSFLFLVFLNCFIEFAKLVQTKSNKVLNYSNIHH
jgi:hypothetical protein